MSLETKLHERYRQELLARLEIMIIEGGGSRPSCINCDRFNEKDEVCRLWHARPPARVIANGCEKFEVLIPF